MKDGYLFLEQDDLNKAYYFVYTKNGALFYGPTNDKMELADEWKLVSVNEETADIIH